MINLIIVKTINDLENVKQFYDYTEFSKKLLFPAHQRETY